MLGQTTRSIARPALTSTAPNFECEIINDVMTSLNRRGLRSRVISGSRTHSEVDFLRGLGRIEDHRCVVLPVNVGFVWYFLAVNLAVWSGGSQCSANLLRVACPCRTCWLRVSFMQLHHDTLLYCEHSKQGPIGIGTCRLSSRTRKKEFYILRVSSEGPRKLDSRAVLR